jgi:hypothetical protein
VLRPHRCRDHYLDACAGQHLHHRRIDLDDGDVATHHLDFDPGDIASHHCSR